MRRELGDCKGRPWWWEQPSPLHQDTAKGAQPGVAKRRGWFGKPLAYEIPGWAVALAKRGAKGLVVVMLILAGAGCDKLSQPMDAYARPIQRGVTYVKPVGSTPCVEGFTERYVNPRLSIMTFCVPS